MRPRQLTGKIFGNLKVIKRDLNYHVSPCGRKTIKWVCECSCGQIISIVGGSLTRGLATSCGCERIKKLKLSNTKHGMTGSTEYNSWMSMRKRCYTQSDIGYDNYGGRGIKVCDRWLNSFENFYEDMGRKPSEKHTIERIDVNKDYTPNNCRWATMKEQSNNKRNNLTITHLGTSISLKKWCELNGLEYDKVRHKYKNGIPLETIKTMIRNKDAL